MELVSIETARLTHLFLLDEVRSLKAMDIPKAFDLISQRYEFAIQPNIAQAATEGHKFQYGRLRTEKREIVVQEIAIFSDGIVVSSADTDDAEMVADDFLEWSVSALGMRKQKTHIGRWYASGIVVDFDPRISGVLSLLDKTRRGFESEMKSVYGFETNAELNHFSIAGDPKEFPESFNPSLIFERRAGTSFSVSRYFCGAQLPTDSLIQLITSFEAELLAI